MTGGECVVEIYGSHTPSVGFAATFLPEEGETPLPFICVHLRLRVLTLVFYLHQVQTLRRGCFSGLASVFAFDDFIDP